MPPKISILLPVYNGGPYLEPCLASVFAQTEKDFELLISDDGSTDASLRIAQSFADSRLQIFQGPRRGLFANLNLLLSKAAAPIVRILCQDDRLQARCLERELRFLATHPLTPITFCKANRMDSDGNLLTSPALNDLPDILSPDLAQQHFFFHGCIAGNLSTVCFRKQLVERHGKFDEAFSVSGDYEYWSRICEREYLGVVQEPLVDLRVHKAQLSQARSSQARFVTENRRIRARILKVLPATICGKARVFERVRHDVLDFHTALRAAIDGNITVCFGILSQFSPLRLATAAVAWAGTLNNRLFRPQAPWVLSCPWSPSHRTSHAERMAA